MKTNNFKAVELFAGIGGFRLGLTNANIETIWANDINQLSCQVYESNFGKDSIVLGDINKIPISCIPNHDILTAGFPCQPFSPAGKKLGVRDSVRGSLFERIVEIINEKQPKHFLLENVKRLLTMENGYHFRVILNALSELDYFIEWRIISPISFGIPQNRDRIFIFGTKFNSTDITSEVLEKTSIFLTQPDLIDLENIEILIEKNMMPIDANKCKNYNWGITYKNKMLTLNLSTLPDIKPRQKLKDILQDDLIVDAQFDFTSDTLERIKKSKPVNRYCDGVELLYNQDGGARLGYTIFGINGIASTLTASTSRHYERYQIGNKFRRLTNVEYARLMGFPDDWCRVARIYDQYALFGNAIVPACVEWVCQRIGKVNIEFTKSSWQQLSLAI
ncbi:DNA cytosine methyltransferase [Anabaena cylindrica FACHB-243]|uniref:Cytosine-specific methyltransferase n=1 Tax=Anabaena cylindrica (strain ATCC 27899 / PCC 7122) TaxID=272123 RepID=K9ZIX7_ANACC|nr:MULTISPECIES: DNA cytosine methyltransferase [Anabaena]AFZ58699.1 DNA-cytosine methyltransferase [Anabaena cylindrica PCC 7122]MBD2420042.1 DNA cytosine methyltransferase [Anabaena cylindrica FACHB-243]MBY5282987.1 DNA cytosine methyltransferase [Anabaena sp. CCAP 1446/1C]MBY5306514.1 DNA cytosine methyltransferase [Anabaena sp. CCAP 1446/1C]MCM2407062.1 DNA cytosine methyltransferase [Anabaena sp. CCAP 1446/1C]